MAKSKLVIKSLGFNQSMERAAHHHKYRTRKKNYNRAKRYFDICIKRYGYLPIPKEWL